MKILKRITEKYKVDTEVEAEELIQEAKDGQVKGAYELTKYESKNREKKAKGEVIETWCDVILQKDFSEDE